MTGEGRAETAAGGSLRFSAGARLELSVQPTAVSQRSVSTYQSAPIEDQPMKDEGLSVDSEIL